MIENRFELIPNLQGQVDIVDHVESEEKNAICIYNDLGVLPFTSAPSLCDLLNALYKENKQLKFELNKLSRENRRFEIFIQRLYDVVEENGSLSKCRAKAEIQWFREQC